MLSTSKTAQYFGDIYRHHLQDRRAHQETNQQKQNQLAACFCWFLAPPKRGALSELHGITSQKNVLSIMGAGRIILGGQTDFQGEEEARIFSQEGQPNFLVGGAGQYACKL
jgi:hypothetical protein